MKKIFKNFKKRQETKKEGHTIKNWSLIEQLLRTACLPSDSLSGQCSQLTNKNHTACTKFPVNTNRKSQKPNRQIYKEMKQTNQR